MLKIPSNRSVIILGDGCGDHVTSAAKLRERPPPSDARCSCDRDFAVPPVNWESPAGEGFPQREGNVAGRDHAPNQAFSLDFCVTG